MTQQETPHDFRSAMDFLASFTDYEQKAAHLLSRRSMDLGRMKRNATSQKLLPHDFPVIHIAGSKGKGSTALFADSILRAHELSVGRFLSPHLINVTERIAINGIDVSQEEFALLVQRLAINTHALIASRSSDIPTFFEAIALMALDAFAQSKVDAAVFEVGLGGRLDATNIVNPTVCLITSIDLEHTRILGKDRSSIAREKAGIIKQGVPIISGVPADTEAGGVIAEIAASRHAPLTWIDDVFTASGDHASFSIHLSGFEAADLQPETPILHQLRNAALAIAAADKILTTTSQTLDRNRIQSALNTTQLRGRLQWIPASGSPLKRDILVDSAHTFDSMQALATELKRRFPGQRVPLLTALLNDKSPDHCLEPLRGLISQIFTTSVASPRSTSAADLSAAIQHSWPTTPTLATGHTLEDLENLPLAPHLPLIIAGSTYLAGEILKELESFPIEP